MRALASLAFVALCACPIAETGDPEALLLAAGPQIVADAGTELKLGKTLALSARAIDVDGKPIEGPASFIWHTVGAEGPLMLAASPEAPPGRIAEGPSVVVSAAAIGDESVVVDLAVAYGTVSSSVGVRVADSVARVQVSGPGSIALGAVAYLNVAAYDAASERLFAPIVLTVENTDIVATGPGGQVRGVAVGTTEVRGRLAGSAVVSGPFVLQVRP